MLAWIISMHLTLGRVRGSELVLSTDRSLGRARDSPCTIRPVLLVAQDVLAPTRAKYPSLAFSVVELFA